MKQANNAKNKTNVKGGQRNLPSTMKTAPTSQQLHTSKASPSSTDQQSWWKELRFSERVLLPLRLFLGITFLYAGIQKLTDPQYFNPSATGFIGKQIMAFAHGSPIDNVLLYVALPHAVFFGALIALGEIAIGIGTLVGFLFRPAAFFGMLLSLMFFFSASWHVYPYFYGADIVFFFAWTPLLLAGPLGSGLPSIDAVLVRRILRGMPSTWRGRMGIVFNFLLGVGDVVEKQNVQREVMPAQAANRINGRGRNATLRQSQENRRNFLWGLVAGGLGMLGITVAGRVILSHPFGGDDNVSTITQSPSTASGTQSPPGSGTSTTTASGSTEIAQVSAVQPNSSVTFTIPSNGDPGVLVRLNNGKFVAFDATCTHAGCPVQYDSSSQHLLCPCHGAEFDPSNAAAVVQGPTNTPLTSVPLSVNNSTGAITLQ
jgi:thiosulfate dehydrogenase [quinone] large subunit